jgi:CHAT domain-containing protein/tetratricopeptide (TPR) repeat protein
VHNNISSLYLNRKKETPVKNIEKSLQHSKLALEIFTKSLVPVDWAQAQNNLANALSKRFQEEQSPDIDEILKHYNLAMEIYTREGFPFEWANIQCGIGIVYRDLIFEDSAKNIETSIEFFNKAGECYKRENYLFELAKTKNELGRAYDKRILGNHVGNIETAIFHFDEALNILKRNDYPFEWAMAQNNRANSYLNRIKGDRSENIEFAITCCNDALGVWTKEAFPEGWAIIQNNLANAHTERISGDRVDNIERAIFFYGNALTVMNREYFPKYWASIQNNLSKAYGFRLIGDEIKNRELAIHYCNEALKVYTKENYPEKWAIAQNNLGEAYKKRLNGDRSENMEKSIECYIHAMEVHTQDSFPREWAMIENNLATAFMDRISGKRDNNIEMALFHYDQALMVFEKEQSPLGWANLQNNKGNALYERILGDHSENIKQAILSYEKALEILHPELFPNYCRRTAHRLGDIFFNQSLWKDAAGSYQLAIEASERLYQASLFRSSREAELLEAGDLYRKTAYSLAKSGLMNDAVVVLERGRARGLSEALCRDRADLERIQTIDPESYRLYKKAIELLRQLDIIKSNRGSTSSKSKIRYESLREIALEAQNKLSQAIERIRCVPGYEGFLNKPNFNDIIDAVTKDMPIIYLLSTPDDGLGLCVHFFIDGSGSQGITTKSIHLKGLNEDYLRTLLDNWIHNYHAWLGNFSEENKKLWLDTIDNVTGILWEKLMDPVFHLLQPLGFKSAFFISTGLLSLLPIYAAWKIKDGKRNYALDELSFAFAPSSRTITQSRRIARSTQANKLLAIDEPMPVKASHLPTSSIEVAAIKGFFRESEILAHEMAKCDDLLRAIQKSDVVHFSCHGGVNWNRPEKSGLLMANDEMLTIEDLFEVNLKGARMATLSACETGIIGTKLPDEVISLPSAFLRAGFAGVVASLWTVSDKSTGALMKSFYEFWQKDGLTPVIALRKAQLQLREIKGFEHPFYWAAFYLTGV